VDSASHYQASTDDISLKELIQALWQARWAVAGVTILYGAAAALAAWITPKSYEASVIVSPVLETPGGGQLGSLGSLASQFGGLASLAGISVSGDAKKLESLAVLQSRTLTENYIRENDLLPILFPDRWDADSGSWKESITGKVPTFWQANKLFERKIRDIETNNSLGLTTLTITWTDPELAAKWANDLVKLTNDYLRAEAIARSERNIAFLNEQAENTDVVGAKQAIYSILENEVSNQMLARGTEEYAFRIIDPAARPEVPSSPNFIAWISIAVFGSLLLSVVVIFARLAWAKS